MNVFEASSTQRQMHEPAAEPMQVKLDLLPPLKQLVMESRQLQTIADLLMQQSERQITTAKRRITFLNLLHLRLRQRSPAYMNFEQERQVFQQEQTHLLEDFSVSRQLPNEGERPTHTEQQLRQMIEYFSGSLASLQQRFASSRQAFRDRLDALRDQHVLVREQEDPLQRQRASQEVREQYLQLREELRKAQEHLREQQETYGQLRLDYQAALDQLRVEKADIEQRQEARKSQG
jgi:hypothetical protein